MPLYNPLICIDTREQKVTKEEETFESVSEEASGV